MLGRWVTRIHDCTALGSALLSLFFLVTSTTGPASITTTMTSILPVLRRSRGSRPPEATTTQMLSLHRDQHSNAAHSFPRPTRPQIFFGRDDELNTIIDLILSSASTARIAILGPGGIGKTVLAHAVLTNKRVVHRFGDSRYFVQCESLSSRDALIVALAYSFSLLQPGTTVDSSLEPRVLSSLGSKKCILCLDTFESPWDQPGPGKKAVESLLAHITALSTVTVLITMRGTERPKGTTWTRPRLPPLINFPRDAAKRTWESLAGTCDEWAEKLIDAVDCLPLAVTLLCGLAKVSTTKTLWKRWREENIALLEKKRGDKLASLEFSITLSLESSRMAADGSSKRLLGILCLLPDGMPALLSPEFRRLFPDIPDISRSLDTLLKCSLAVRTADQMVQVSSLVRLFCKRHNLASPEDVRALRGYNAHHHSQFLTPKGVSFPTPPLTTARGRQRSSGVCEMPVRDVTANTSQPVIPTTRPAPQSSTGTRAHLPAALGGHELSGDSAIAPASTWWKASKRKRMIPVEQTDEYIHTRTVRPFLSPCFSDTYAL